MCGLWNCFTPTCTTLFLFNFSHKHSQVLLYNLSNINDYLELPAPRGVKIAPWVTRGRACITHWHLVWGLEFPDWWESSPVTETFLSLTLTENLPSTDSLLNTLNQEAETQCKSSTQVTDANAWVIISRLPGYTLSGSWSGTWTSHVENSFCREPLSRTWLPILFTCQVLFCD